MTQPTKSFSSSQISTHNIAPFNRGNDILKSVRRCWDNAGHPIDSISIRSLWKDQIKQENIMSIRHTFKIWSPVSNHRSPYILMLSQDRTAQLPFTFFDDGESCNGQIMGNGFFHFPFPISHFPLSRKQMQPNKWNFRDLSYM